MNQILTVAVLMLAVAIASPAAAADNHPPYANNDRDRVDQRYDQRGDRIDARLDRQGESLQQYFNRQADRADALGKHRLAEQLRARGKFMAKKLDRKGDRINDRLDRQGEHLARRFENRENCGNRHQYWDNRKMARQDERGPDHFNGQAPYGQRWR
jgi:hypothetical protein